MRSAKECDVFPYTSKANCYIEIKSNGEICQIAHHRKSDFENVVAAYNRAISGQSKLYCVWPGNYTSDLFEIDDIDVFSKAFKISNM